MAFERQVSRQLFVTSYFFISATCIFSPNVVEYCVFSLHFLFGIFDQNHSHRARQQFDHFGLILVFFLTYLILQQFPKQNGTLQRSNQNIINRETYVKRMYVV